MLVLCKDQELRERVREIFEESRFKMTFSKRKMVSGGGKSLISRHDLLCVLGEMGEGSPFSTCIMTIPDALKL